MSGSFGAQVVLDPASPAALGARGGAASTIHGNTVARDLGLISNGLDPLLTAGPPNVVVPFSLNFMRPGWLDPGVTFTRASTATYTDATGTIQTAAVNAPRWDYAGGSLRGLLIEEARTNLFLNSATLVTQGVTVTATAYTLSFYGTGTITKSGAATGALVGTGAGQRVSQTFTPTAGTLTCTVTGSVTNAQIEAGAFATSWISSAGASATRAVDQCQITPLGAWYNAASYSLFAEFDTAAAAGVVAGIASAFGDASYLSASGWNVIGASGTPVGPAITLGSVNKQCASLAPARLAVSNNGSAVVSTANGAAAQTAATRLSIGMSPWGMDTLMNGHMRRIQYWNRTLSDAELQAVTT
jgi:hypothetical protein